MQEAPLTFRLYQDVEFNRPVDRDKYVVSPGGYKIMVKDEKGQKRSVQFDFDDYEGHIDEKDPSVVHCMQKNPSYDEFEDLDSLTVYMLRHITKVEEWFIFTGEPHEPKAGETPLMPVKIRNPVFDIITSDGEFVRIAVTADIKPCSNYED